MSTATLHAAPDNPVHPLLTLDAMSIALAGDVASATWPGGR